MKLNRFLRKMFIFGLIFLITYALAEGIQYGSTLGTVLALCSLSALAVAIYLFRKLSRLNSEE